MRTLATRLAAVRPSAAPSTIACSLQPCSRERPARRCYSEKAPERDFRGQLMASIQERRHREEKEQGNFSSLRSFGEATGGGRGGGYSIVIPFFAIFGALGGYHVAKARFHDPSEASTLPLAAVGEIKHDTSPSTLQAAWSDFRDVVGEANVHTAEADVSSHAGSEWSTHPVLDGDRPWCVLTPSTTEEVSGIMEICHRRRIPVTAYSGGTSLEGHFAATRGGICIDFGRMDRILALHGEDLDVVVQPAVGWESLNETLGEHGLFFPPDPGPGAMIGGMIGTGCSGTNAYRYGTMKDWVIGLTVVLADGTIIKTKQRPRKSSAGYDLTRTFVGSEGTLGLVTEATLKLTVKPQSTSVAVCTFPDVRSAADAARAVVKSGVPVAAVELLDDVQMRCINDAGSTSRKWEETATIFFKFGGTPASIKEHVALVRDLSKTSGSRKFEFARSDDEAAELWSARKEALWSVMAKKRGDHDRVWTTDVAVPISRLPDIVELTKDDISASGLTGSIVGHVGDGNFHAIILYDERREFELVKDLVHRMVRRAVEMEGTATGEHGVGLVKRDYLEKEVGPTTVNLMRRMKLAFDPLCLLNCDKVVRVQEAGKDEVKAW